MTIAASAKPRPDIGIVTLIGLPVRLDDLVDALDNPDVCAALHSRRPGPMAGLELYLPSAVALFIASSYFSGAIQKAGEDHYLELKAAALTLWRRVRGVGESFPARPRGASAPNYSLAWSIVGETQQGVRFKLVLTTQISDADAQSAIGAFLDTVRAIEEGMLSTTDQVALRTYPIIGGQVVVTFDTVTRRIVPVPFKPAAPATNELSR